MATKQDRSLDQAKEGFFNELFLNLRLILRLMKDKRVNVFFKLLPVGALLYWVIPFDFLPVNPLDDALVIWVGFTMFLELCPDEVVAEHRAALRGQVQGKSSPDVVEGTYKDLN
jgi:uncharacterized membrane protein YkvA (DUF1232 family)